MWCHDLLEQATLIRAAVMQRFLSLDSVLSSTARNYRSESIGGALHGPLKKRDMENNMNITVASSRPCFRPEWKGRLRYSTVYQADYRFMFRSSSSFSGQPAVTPV